MKKTYLLLAVALIIIISAIVLRFSTPEDDWVCKAGQWQKHGNPSAPMPTTSCAGGQIEGMVGNDRDEHGCIGSAGYTWCAAKEKCLRIWEENCEAGASTTIPVANEPQATFSDEIMILNPKQDQVVTSPLKVEGQAKGTWFFEASLPVKLIDSNNNLIVAHYGTAQGDWMTEKPVKFSSDLVFTTTATSGYLVVSRDNPSGLPQNDASIKVPVRFK